MTVKSNASLSRRNALKLAAAGIATLAMPAIVRAAGGSLKVGVYGGYFKDSFDKHVFPAFTKASGIEMKYEFVRGRAMPTASSTSSIRTASCAI